MMAEDLPAEIGGVDGCFAIGCKFSERVCGRRNPFFECSGCAVGSRECACTCYALTVRCGNDCDAYFDCIAECEQGLC